jgi:hypothetical protein
MAEKFNWAKYEAQAEAPSEFDWSKYENQDSQGVDSVVDERAPQISFADRAIAKNLAQSPLKQMEYLKSKYPSLDIKLAGSDVLIRDGDSYKKLDPSGLEFEDVSDIGDVVASGITSTLGAVGGGMAGALAGGAGAVPGAFAGTAAAGSATEAFRQKLGQKLGIPQDVSGSDVALAGAGNLVGSGLFGTGNIAKGAYKGLIRDAWNKGAPAFSQFMTGVTPEVLKTYTNPATREEVKSLIKGGKTEFTEKLVNKIRGGLNQQKEEIGTGLSNAINTANQSVNIEQAKAPFRSEIARLKMIFRQFPTPENKAAVDAAEMNFDSLFKDLKKSAQAFEIPDSGVVSQKIIKKTVPFFEQAPGNPLPNIEDTILKSPSDGLRPAIFETASLPVSGPTLPQYLPKVRTENVVERVVGPNVIVNPKAVVPNEVSPPLAWRLQQQLKDYGDLKKIGGGINSRFSSQATMDEKAGSQQALSAYQAINNELDRVTAGASPEFKAQYSDLKDIQSTLAPHLRTDQSAYSTFTNMDGKSKVAFKEALEKLGKRTGDDYASPINMLQSADYFGSNSWTPRSIGGSTSTTRTLPGMVAGGLIGGSIGSGMGPMGIAAGGAVGTKLGAASASPNALKAIIENTDFLRYGADQMGRVMDYGQVTPLVRETIIQSPWFGM